MDVPMKTIDVYVQGSAELPYLISFFEGEKGPMLTCTCPAGMVQMLCKHREALFLGDITAIGQGDGPAIVEAIWTSTLMDAYASVQAANAAVEKAKRQLKAEKKRLGRLMG